MRKPGGGVQGRRKLTDDEVIAVSQACRNGSTLEYIRAVAHMERSTKKGFYESVGYSGYRLQRIIIPHNPGKVSHLPKFTTQQMTQIQAWLFDGYKSENETTRLAIATWPHLVTSRSQFRKMMQRSGFWFRWGLIPINSEEEV